ncbi:sensor domain-containing diguanylate cyclase [Alteraurantiacibacter aquimixticola]|uniref:diguanylate cyclase n=1 Tax=Alteraurantiacibacter aquimixticola TaxID=2489173 RepID=A0A4T3F4S8_9SPHN|nr:sensor domain-containing diguanylate cyclase [Alteraurantiacibacter aquimixticola]TIX50508.1 sensor domain-containing diguanylate cyclase [Alteraurantiacibacter aquimixticola]
MSENTIPRGRFDPFIAPVITGAIWYVAALGSIYLRDTHGAVLILWLPAAVGVAALYAHDVRKWPAHLLAIFAAEMLVAAAIPVPVESGVVFAIATVAEALVCARIGISVLGGRGEIPRSLAQIAGLFLAAVVGSAAGALISFPFRTIPTLPELAWWFLASVLGILAGTPVLLFLRQRLGFGDQGVKLRGDNWPGGIGLAIALLALLAFLVLSFPLLPFTALLMVGMAAVAVRYGQLGAAFALIAYGLVGTGLSVGGNSPVANLDMSPRNAGLYLQALLMVMLAATLPLAALLMSRDALEGKLRGRNKALQQSLAIFDLAESVAGIGRWRYDLRTGAQEWSPRMLELNGLPPSLAPDPGYIRDLMPDGGSELFGQIAVHRGEREPYGFTYRVAPYGEEEERILHISVLNEFDDAGERIALFAVAMDVTEQARREEALEEARGRAVQLAAEAQKLANTDPLTGLANRRCSINRLRRLVDETRGQEQPLTVVMFDIDHFKLVNDGYGHQTGDDVLVHVAEIAREQVRERDLVGRIGGEEFVWLLPGMSAGRATQLAERLRCAIEKRSGDSNLPPVTASVGLATLRAGEDAEGVLARADRALYLAKDAGRNQVRMAA